MRHPRRGQPFDGLMIQRAEQHLAQPGILDDIAQCRHAFIRGVHARRAGMALIGDMNLADRLGAPGQVGPDPQALEQSAAAMGQRRGAVVVTRLPAALDRRLGLDQANLPAGLAGAILQPQRQTGTDHAAADDVQAGAHAGRSIAARARAISASISSASRGTLPVSTSWPSRVTTTSSSMRIPMPRHLAGTSMLSTAM